MQGSNQFKVVIENYLKKRVLNDSLFKETFQKPNKNIDDCIKYILNTVKKQNVNGMTDAEVFGLAVHYYDEDEIDIGGDLKCKVLVNHHIELTDEEKELEKEKARQQVFNEHKEMIHNTKKKRKKKNNQKTIVTPTLFNY